MPRYRDIFRRVKDWVDMADRREHSEPELLPKESNWEQGQNIPKVSDLFDDDGKPLPEDDRLMFLDFGDFVR